MKKMNFNIYDSLQNNHINNIPILNDDHIIMWGQNNENIIEHCNSYLQTILMPNSHGPIEKHPYIDFYENYFNLNNRFLLLGTFPPSSYFNNQIGLMGLPNPNLQNNIPLNFYYGNENNLWKFLFNLQQEEITVNSIIHQLNLYNISITDVFYYVQRAKMISPNDQDLKNLVLNKKIINIFNENSQISTILFTSGSLEKIFKESTSTLVGFRWLLSEYLENFDALEFSGDITGEGVFYPFNIMNINDVVLQQNGGIVWWIRLGTKKIKMINLPSPSAAAQIRMPNSNFFKKWVYYKANENDIPLPNNEQQQNLIEFTQLFPNIYSNSPTIKYREDIYFMALNNILDLI